MRLVTFKQLRLVFGIPFSPQHIGRLEKAGKFPLRRKIGNFNFWMESDVEDWIRKLRKPAMLPEPGE